VDGLSGVKPEWLRAPLSLEAEVSLIFNILLTLLFYQAARFAPEYLVCRLCLLSWTKFFETALLPLLVLLLEEGLAEESTVTVET
jgi:hypothetical protein